MVWDLGVCVWVGVCVCVCEREREREREREKKMIGTNTLVSNHLDVVSERVVGVGRMAY